MGRTNPTYRAKFEEWREQEMDQWRRALRRDPQERWDELLDRAEQYAVAGDNLNETDIRWPVVWSMLLAQQEQIHVLEKKIGELSTALFDAGVFESDESGPLE